MGKERNSDTAFQETNPEFESQRYQLHQASRWADQAERDKISLYVEMEMRSRVLQENHARDCQEIEDHARDCQEIEELRRICCEESHRAKQTRIVYASRDESYDCESVVDSDSGILEQNEIPCQTQENFTVLNQEAALERPTFPINPQLF